MNFDCPTMQVAQGDWGLMIGYGYGDEGGNTDNQRHHYLLGEEDVATHGLCGNWMNPLDSGIWSFSEILQPTCYNGITLSPSEEIMEDGCPDCDKQVREIVRLASQALATGRPVTDSLSRVHPSRWGIWVVAGRDEHLMHVGVHPRDNIVGGPSSFNALCGCEQVPLFQRVGLSLEYMRVEEPPLGNGYCPDCLKALPILAKSALSLLYPDWNWETI